MNRTLRGRKGGSSSSSSRTPVEQPDDLQSAAIAHVLMALGEGEFAGGLSDRTIFLDGTPLRNSDGSENFPGVTWEFRSGTQSQGYIQGMPGAENEISVGTEVRDDVSWTRTFYNLQLSGVRVRLKWPSLYQQKDNGDLVGYAIDYVIELQTDGGSWQTMVSTRVSGKTTGGYERTHRIDLPQASTSWTLRVRRLTLNANNAKTGDTMTVQSFTECIDAKFRYPHTALLYLRFDSRYFNGSLPQISCEPQGRVVRVPSNYDPLARTYSGLWDGLFKWAWTDNPAWVFYDLAVTDRFGLGQRLTMANLDKWTLYQVGQYCDELVPDGKGGSGMQPRHTCNVYIQDRNHAWTVVRDFVAIFRGMTCWTGEQLMTLADMPRDVDYVYTRANVIGGKFNYSSSTTSVRYSSAMVSWSDPANAFADAMEPVFEADLVSRYGFNQLEMTAIGCIFQSEANRKGRWGILTNNKDRVVSFSVGLDGQIPLPGYVVAIADDLLSGRVMGGRISAVSGRVLTLDRVPDAAVGDRLMVNLPSGISQARTLSAVNGREVTVSTAYSETPQAECVWLVESTALYAQQYRVVSVSDNNDGSWTITGTAHDPDKYARIDLGAVIDTRPISVVPASHQLAPQNIVLSAWTVVSQGLSVETMHAEWDRAEGAIDYEAQWRRDDGNWVSMPRASIRSFEVRNIYAGRYQVRVRAINAAEISSGWGYSDIVTFSGKQGNPPVPQNFHATALNWGVQLDWTFGADTADTAYTEVQYATEARDDLAILLADVPYPQGTYVQMGLKAGQTFWYRARLTDTSGNVSPWTDWLMGGASADAQGYLVDIDNQIRETDAWKSLTGDMADLSQETTELHDRVDAISDHMDVVDGELTGLGETLADQVESDISNALANNTAFREQVAEMGASRASILRIDQTIATEKEATAQTIEAIRAEVDGNRADILTEATARATADEAIGETITVVQAQVDDNTASISEKVEMIVSNATANNTAFRQQVAETATSRAAITRLDETIAGDREATARAIEQVKAEVGEDIVSAVSTESAARAREDEALGTRIDAIEVKVGEDVQAAILSEAQARATADEALGTRIDSVSVQTGKDITAAVQTEATARATADGALGTRIDNLTAQTGKDITAAVQAESQARATADGALGTRIDQVKATADGASAAVQTTAEALATTNGKLAAQWGVKVQVEANGTKRIAGIQLGIDATGSSAFIISADTFAVYNTTTGGATLPFVITGGQVYMQSALIQDGTITTAKIADSIQSTNFVSGSTGWCIQKWGWAEFNNVTVRGTVYASSGTFSGTVNANAGTFNNVTINENCTVKRIYAENIYGDLIDMSDPLSSSRMYGRTSTGNGSTLYTVCSVKGAPFARKLLFMTGVSFSMGAAGLSQTAVIYVNGVEVWRVTSYDSSINYTPFSINLPATSYDTTQTITVQFTNGSTSGWIGIGGVLAAYRASETISIAPSYW